MTSLLVPVAVVLGGMVSAAPPEANPCTNGSFERLGARGFPADWEPVGRTVGPSDDAHTGRRALRMVRTADSATPETGLNRAWQARSGRRGAMIDRRRGGIDFWYKAVSADGAELVVYAIPMTADPIEGTGSPRAAYVVPRRHVGDGQWHHARLRYDFTDDPKARWVHFAARIVGKAGELLLDDVSYVQRVGVILRFGRVDVEADASRPGRRATLRARIENAGDVPARDVRLRLALPRGLKATPGEARLPELAVDDSARLAWTLEGRRDQAGSLGLTASSGETRAETSLELAPKLVLESFGPAAPVFVAGKPVRLECVLRNDGDVVVCRPRARFETSARAGGMDAAADELAPGRRIVLATSFVPKGNPAELTARVRVQADNVPNQPAAETRVLFIGEVPLAAPAGRLRATTAADAAVLENEHVRLLFRRAGFGFGPGELQARTPAGWRTVAWLPRLSRLAHRLDDRRVQRIPMLVSRSAPQAETGRTARLVFHCRAAWPPPSRAAWRLTATFELAAGARTIAADYRLTCDRDAELLAFDGPMLYALDRDEAVFPGLEWLVDDELSSGTLDIGADHPHRERYVVHPNMVTVPAIGVHGRGGTVGLLWDVQQKWDGQRSRPSAVFASPDRWNNQRAHLMGLFLPTVPEYVQPNQRTASRPYPLRAKQGLRLRCRLYADGAAAGALSAIDAYLRHPGLPEPPPLPHGSWNGEIQFSMRGYLESLWQAESKQWWTTKGGHPLMSRPARPRQFVADLLLGEIASPAPRVRKRCRSRAEEVLGLIGGEARYAAQRRPGRVDMLAANPAAAAALLAARRKDGTWRFDADRKDRGVFRGKDYSELGPHDAVEVGTCAHNAFLVLRYARIAGDWQAYEQMQSTLERMEGFRVPRAAQVWEVPVHTPDILAAADAVDAYVEAYRFAGEKRWLRGAVAWARRGLPFVYLWHDPRQPFLLGGSIPVFGATWYRGSWFGRPVQWNGLRYANALLKLSAYDRSRPWRRIAELLIRSAVHQQDLEGRNAALWPDNVSAIDGAKCPWVFAPRQILRNILKLTGRDEDLATVIVGRRRRRLHLSAAGAIDDAEWDGSRLSFRVTFPKGMEGVVLVSNVERPAEVSVAGREVGPRRDVEKGTKPGWRYDAAYGYLSIRTGRDGESAVRIEGARFRQVDRLPRPATSINFGFDESPEGWIPQHHVARLRVRDGALCGAVTGGDPYLVRPNLRVRGEACPVVRLRLRVSAGKGGQFYWTTASSPHFAEDKVVPFSVRSDGRFHEYRLDLARHPQWAGQTITAIRVDPGNGAKAAEFAIDYIRGAKE